MELQRAARFARWVRRWHGTMCVLALLVWAGSAQGFFPALPPGAVAGRNGNTQGTNGSTTPPGNDHTTPPGNNTPPSGSVPSPPPPPPGGPPSDNGPPDTPPDTPPTIDTVPEMDFSAVVGACGLLLTGTLIFTDRRRRA